MLLTTSSFMKHFTLFLLALIGSSAIAQSNFTQGFLTDNNGKETSIYLKERESLINNDGVLSVYTSTSKNSKVSIRANELRSVKFGNDILIISAIVDGFENNNPIILRKLVAGERELYEHIDSSGNITFFDKHNQAFLLLKENIDANDKSSEGFKKWIYNNFNPANKDANIISELKYTRNDLSDYYLENAANAILLSQEPKVKTFNLGINGSYVSNELMLSSGVFDEINNISDSNFGIALTAFINLDPLKNRHTVITGITYYTPYKGSSTFQNRSTGIVRETSIERQLVSLKLGYAYNIHAGNFTVSPFLNMEPNFAIGTNSISSTQVSGSNAGFKIYENPEINTSPFNINVGIMSTIYKKGYLFFEYTLSNNYNITVATGNTSNSGLEINNNRFSLGLGYQIF